MDFLTLSCRPPVTMSMMSEKKISPSPSSESLPPFFFFPSRLKRHTPAVISATWKYSISE